MSESELHVVTGAFGFSGKYIAGRLLAEGHRVRTLTNSLHRANPFAGRVEAHPYHFDNFGALVESLRGAAVLYNTYWVRFNHRNFRHAEAVENTEFLFRAAREAGVGRIVHVSITNPSQDSDLEYFAGKARLEKNLAGSGVPHSVLRPAVLFGKEDILVNNIAWALRKFPVFGVFGDGEYGIQPIFVEDFAALAVAEGKGQGNRTLDAIGPETFTYRGLVRKIGTIIGVKRPILGVPPAFGFAVGAVVGWMVGDVVITRDEIEGLMRGLLCTGSPPAGKTALTAWAAQNASSLGARYASELARRKDREKSYGEL